MNRYKAFIFTSLILMFLLLLPASACFAQITLSGFLVNDKEEPIQYANVTLNNRGTITDEQGYYKIAIEKKDFTDTLRFHALGFKNKSLPISYLSTANDNLKVILETKAVEISEVRVEIKKKPSKEHCLGNSNSNLGYLLIDSICGGTSMALLIGDNDALKKNIITITKAQLKIVNNNIGPFKMRVRFLTIDEKTGMPDLDILNRSVVVESDLKKGWMDFDMRDYNLSVTKPFFIAFESVLTENDRKFVSEKMQSLSVTSKTRLDTINIHGSDVERKIIKGTPPGTMIGISSSPSSYKDFTCYFRKNSVSEWVKAPAVLTARVFIEM